MVRIQGASLQALLDHRRGAMGSTLLLASVSFSNLHNDHSLLHDSRDSSRNRLFSHGSIRRMADQRPDHPL